MDIERLKELEKEVSSVVFIALSRLTDKNARTNTVKFGNDLKELIDEAIARQSVKSEDVAGAIEYYRHIADITKGEESLAETSANLAIAALQEYRPWVSVEDRLPEDNVPVLVAYLGCADQEPFPDNIAKWSIEANSYNGGWLWRNDDSEVKLKITHWKPLSEPPKGE